MSHIKQVEVNGKTYNVTQASAIDQKNLLLMVGGRVALNSASAEIDTINTVMMKGILITTPPETFDKIAAIVLHKTVLHGSSELITIENFSNNMNDYFTLVAEAIRVNLSDFFV